MISDSPYRSHFPPSGPDRQVGSLNDLSDADVLRRAAITFRKEARNAMADRLEIIAYRIDALTQLIKEP